MCWLCFGRTTDDAVEQGIVDDEFAFDFENISDDANIMVLAGKINAWHLTNNTTDTCGHNLLKMKKLKKV